MVCLNIRRFYIKGFAADGIYPGKLPKYRNLAEYNSEFMISARCFSEGDENQVARYICNNRRNPAAYGIINYMAYQDSLRFARIWLPIMKT